MEISDYTSYLQEMSLTYDDKCWWIDHIDENINTIVDFGCADAGIFEYIETKYPHRFTYIGIDNNEKMLAIAKEKYGDWHNAQFYSSFYAAKDNVDFAKTVIVFNSVIHEIFSYLEKSEVHSLFSDITACQPAYIAIRDMHDLSTDGADYDSFARCIEKNCAEKFNEYRKVRKNSILWSSDEVNANYIVEFLLKYFYDSNWDREVRERYLWNWAETNQFPGYDAVFIQSFHIPFLQEKWEKDFGISVKLNTHKKVLFVPKKWL